MPDKYDAYLLWKLSAQQQIDNFRKETKALRAENAKLREQMEQLVTLLRNDCDIEASWDGLRRFWSIELTEDGCLMRDRVCKAEAENTKLQEFATEIWELLTCNEPVFVWEGLREKAHKLGVEMEE